MLKLLIADSSEEFRLALAEYVAGSYVIRCCQHGKEALELIFSFKPDIVVLDLMMPELDGITLLYRAAERGARPMVLATSRFINDYVQEQMTRLGVGYIVIKPCEVRATAERLRDLSEHLRPLPPARPDAQTLVVNVLLKLGFATKLDGFGYLREAIPIAMHRPGQMMTKQIYPEVGRICNASREQVERSIRSAISGAFQRRDEEIWRQYFTQEPDGTLARPSNGAFITALAERLRHEQYDDHS